ncbi:CDP-glucose 4/6-dehydratase domain protein [Synechococcus sp. RS9909]|nr:CDP-glucose 4/6-dehydratase domain protein [Synechococcus sp. RS9909]
MIGSGDWAADRIVPDAMRALAARAGSRPPALARLLTRWLRPPRPARGRPPAPADRQGPPPARLAAPLACCLAELEAYAGCKRSPA